MTLGEKIRRRRKQLKMTQAELSGSFITRNMISRIETDDIHPSLETLCYLAKRLLVPPGYLLSEEDDLHEWTRPSVMDEVRSHYRAGNDRAALALCAQYGYDDAYLDDEAALLLCECALRLGKQAYRAGSLTDAADWFARALHFADHTAYHTELLRGEAELYCAMLSALKQESPKPHLDAYADTIRPAADTERYLLLSFLSPKNTDECIHTQPFPLSEIHNPLYRAIFSVWQLSENGQIADARNILQTVIDDEAALQKEPLFYYRCIAKMEQLSAMLDDYKTAYLYAEKRRQAEKRYQIQDKEPTL